MYPLAGEFKTSDPALSLRFALACRWKRVVSGTTKRTNSRKLTAFALRACAMVCCGTNGRVVYSRFQSGVGMPTVQWTGYRTRRENIASVELVYDRRESIFVDLTRFVELLCPLFSARFVPMVVRVLTDSIRTTWFMRLVGLFVCIYLFEISVEF